MKAELAVETTLPMDRLPADEDSSCVDSVNEVLKVQAKGTFLM